MGWIVGNFITHEIVADHVRCGKADDECVLYLISRFMQHHLIGHLHFCQSLND